jgi:bla regulator protein blaR1
MSFLNNILSERLIDAVGWTLFHSLWQGALAALGFALVLGLMRRHSARARYFAGVAALMVVLVISVVTFVDVYSASGKVITEPGRAVASLPAVIQGNTAESVALKSNGALGGVFSSAVPAFFRTYFQKHFPLMVTIWLLGVMFLVFRLMGGFLYNQRIKAYRSKPLSKSWQERLENLRGKTSLRSPVRLLESALVKVPMTIGFFKPVILVPLGLVSGLPADQVEALLAHELAHILRKDYLVNMLQSFVDILFFYHPGVRWISGTVRSEREHCCDDIAVTITGGSLNVARALTNIQGFVFPTATAQPAMAAIGAKPRLLERVNRLINPRKAVSTISEGLTGALLLTIGITALVISSSAATAMTNDINKENNGDKKKKVVQQVVPEIPAVPKPASPPTISTAAVPVTASTPTAAPSPTALPSAPQPPTIAPKSVDRKDHELFLAKFKKELINDGLIKDKRNINLKLTHKELIINGVKQPKKIFKKYKKLYESQGKVKLGKNKTFAIYNYNWEQDEPESVEESEERERRLQKKKEFALQEAEKRELEEEIARDRERREQDEKKMLEYKAKLKKEYEIALKKYQMERELNKSEERNRAEAQRIERIYEEKLKRIQELSKIEEKKTRAEKKAIQKELTLLKKELQKEYQKRQIQFNEQQKKEQLLMKEEIKRLKEESQKKKMTEQEKKDMMLKLKKIQEQHQKQLAIEKDKMKKDLRLLQELKKREYANILKEKEKHKKRIVIFKEQLKKDKLITAGEFFELKLNPSSLRINDKNQSKKLFKKYLLLYKKIYGKELKNNFILRDDG